MSKRISNMLVAGFMLVSLSAWSAQVCNFAQIERSTPDARFTNNRDGTVSDTQTGLMWAKCAMGQAGNNCESGAALVMNWAAALFQASNSELATHTNWRLPNIKELGSIVEVACHFPAINQTVFPNTPLQLFWSASPYAALDTSTWLINFEDGSDNTNLRSFAYRTRLVRDE